ncbi:cytidylate kinase [Oleiphilus sp. HI0081]|uniref:(d)CMP kinase n=3 Tax=Oleiphilus TaxID=141450 RepID=UPI0007C3AF4F|nr:MULTISPECIES: (d)CMP kinase [unclassified Oleiphilus]KZY84506.1 cytidylate kinase [Oleiphilus sp. HI0069]KZY86102.1 cytidylate kinase [Oleiphilus sp. HI0072]KZZ11512.1 cytidylate kinase [Oleiphilus sp. HI0078]KZZ22000.1 cytidylate kinase [Oleiphilus sp. HI0081]KZZ42502.1 cytidylate kinase [Oleiphilus sp. HI0085]
MTCKVLTIDGPSGAGKGSIAQLVAKHLGWSLLDSGALYRLTALAATRLGVAFDNEEALAEVAEKLDVEFVPSEYGEPVRVLLGGQDVTNDIRTETVGNDASKIAPLASVRAALLQRQRNFAVEPGLVADGRDMGTVVFPEAEYKVFMTASAEARADRRFKQLKAEGEDVKIAPLLKEIEERDARDMGRKNAPLKAAEDAYHVDTTGLSIEEVLKEVVNFIERKS